MKENQNEMSFIYFNQLTLEKTNQSEMSIFLVTVFVGNQPIRIQLFLKMNRLLFLQNLNHYLKNVYQKKFELPRVTLQ